MSVKLLAFDLDGTLLDRESRLSEANRAAIARAQASGLEVVLVTGRSWRSTRPYYEHLGLTGVAICYLGALVLADGSGRILRYRPLVAAAWEAIRQAALDEGLAVTACAGTDQAVAGGDLPAKGLVAADTAYATCAADDFIDWVGWNPYTVIAPDLAPCTSPPIMVAVYGDRAVGRMRARFPRGLPGSQFDLTDRIRGETVLHVWHAQVDKGRALAEYCRSRRITPREVAAFGDAPMDVGMITFSGLGVAVPDAHPALRAAADLVEEPATVVDRILRGEPHCGD